mgnify:CR=1 FL=1|tara:strand:+ start:2507 stop:3499 length:993 start_codon:yes stop_codon:yes gene_type:complete
MDKRKLSKVVRDVKKILVLAKSAHDHLEKNKINKARRELKRIMGFDADEITRLHDEDEGIAHQLLHECGIVLKDAKQALRDLDSSGLFGKAKELVEEIVKLEGHELIELEEAEKQENSFFDEWMYLLENFKLYHGTISTRLRSIQQKGLDPRERERFYTAGNLKRLLELLSKVEIEEDSYSRSVFTLLDERSSSVKRDLHLAFEKDRAIHYAKMGVETFYQVERAIRKILKSDKLTAQEKHEAQKIARPFINELRQSKPVVLHISLRAPALDIPWLQSFDEYKKFISDECKGQRPWFHPDSLKLHPIGRALQEVVIHDAIPFKFIKVEYV